MGSVIKAGTQDLLGTQEGQIVLGHNCGAFNWGTQWRSYPAGSACDMVGLPGQMNS